MAAGTAYAKRYAGGFVDGSGGGTPIDSTFLNAVEAALLQLIAAAPAATDGLVMQWDNANTRYGPALILNKNVDAAAAIAKSKLDFTGANGLVNADVAGAAAIAYSKLNLTNSVVNGDLAGSIALSKLASVPGYVALRKTTAKAVNTSTAETDLLNGEWTLPANAMGATGTLRITAFGDYKNNSGGTTAMSRFKLIFGGTTLFDTGAVNLQWSNTATRFSWKLVCDITNTAANAQVAVFRMDFTGQGVGGASSMTLPTNGMVYNAAALSTWTPAWAAAYTTGALDTTSSKTLTLTVINPSASASYETQLTSAFAEIL